MLWRISDQGRASEEGILLCGALKCGIEVEENCKKVNWCILKGLRPSYASCKNCQMFDKHGMGKCVCHGLSTPPCPFPCFFPCPCPCPCHRPQLSLVILLILVLHILLPKSSLLISAYCIALT